MEISGTSIVWQPVVSPVQIAAGGATLAALALWSYLGAFRQRPVAATFLALMRLAVIASMAVVLMGPSRTLPRASQLARSKLSVLLDTSASMLTEGEDGVCRIDQARQEWLGDRRLTSLGTDYDVELNGFDEDVRPLPRAQLTGPATALATGRSTRLAESVTQALSRMPMGKNGEALLVLSDGRDSSDVSMQPAAAAAKARGIPIYSVLIGRGSNFRDVALLAVPMQDQLLPAESGGLLVKVYQSGFDGASATVKVTSGGKVRNFPVSFQGKPVVELQVPIQHDEPGQYEYAVSVEPLENEATESNNSVTVYCEVQRKRIRVLLVEGQPYWDTKFIAQALRKDERIELIQISQLTSARRETIVTRTDNKSPRIPATPDEWAACDVVVLGRGIQNVLSPEAAAQLATYVGEQGGHLIFARGPAVDPRDDGAEPIARALLPLEPVRWGSQQHRDLQIALTPAGRISPWFSTTKMGVDLERALQKLSGFEAMDSIVEEKPASVVLARAGSSEAQREPGTGGGQAAIIQMQYGRGSVMAIAGQGLWRWSLLSDKEESLVGVYDSFWSNLVRYLALGGEFPPGQQVSLKLARTTSRLGDRLAIDVAYKHAPPAGTLPALLVVDSDGKTQELVVERRPGREPRFQTHVDPATAGVYRVVLKTPGMTPSEQEQRFSVYDVNEERLNTTVNPMPLKVVAEHSAGGFFEVDQFDAFLERLQRHRQSFEAPPQTEFLWDDWRFLVVLLTWAGIEWIARRRIGLL